jgi:hypothetical protein
MKDWLAKRVPNKIKLDDLHAKVKEAWEAIPNSWLLKLLKSMPERMHCVIKSKGGHLQY